VHSARVKGPPAKGIEILRRQKVVRSGDSNAEDTTDDADCESDLEPVPPDEQTGDGICRKKV